MSATCPPQPLIYGDVRDLGAVIGERRRFDGAISAVSLLPPAATRWGPIQGRQVPQAAPRGSKCLHCGGRRWGVQDGSLRSRAAR